jgi:hypothetical protein
MGGRLVTSPCWGKYFPFLMMRDRDEKNLSPLAFNLVWMDSDSYNCSQVPDRLQFELTDILVISAESN